MASLRIGTRGSPLALAQAHETRRRLAAAHGEAPERYELVVIKTSGDMIQDRALAEAGGKGLFTKEIDAAMLRGEIDVAVHSSKDLPTVLPDGIGLPGYLPREDVRDALISAKSKTIAGLPQGGSLGTASLRRQAQVKRLRPDLQVGLLRGEIDVAVHSSKDLPTVLPEGIGLPGYLPREDVRDALISAKSTTIAGLPQGGTLGTASLRRQAQVKRLRPDLQVGLLRGNVETRLGKAESGAIDATLLAFAGLKRLGLAHRATALLEIEEFLPAVGQGAIGFTARPDDEAAFAALAPILDAATAQALACERAFLAVLDGSCKTPIAGHARLDGGALRFRGAVYRTDGSEAFEVTASGDPADAARLGAEAGRDLLARLPKGVLVG